MGDLQIRVVTLSTSSRRLRITPAQAPAQQQWCELFRDGKWLPLALGQLELDVLGTPGPEEGWRIVLQYGFHCALKPPHDLCWPPGSYLEMECPQEGRWMRDATPYKVLLDRLNQCCQELEDLVRGVDKGSLECALAPQTQEEQGPRLRRTAASFRLRAIRALCLVKSRWARLLQVAERVCAPWVQGEEAP